MNTLAAFVCVAGFTGSLLLLAASTAQPAPDPAVARGAALFVGSGCSFCHRVDLQGGDLGPNLTTVGSHRSTAQLRSQIVHGGGAMPAFDTVLEPAQVDELIAFLRAKPMERARAATQVPVQRIPGHAAYSTVAAGDNTDTDASSNVAHLDQSRRKPHPPGTFKEEQVDRRAEWKP